MRKILILSLLSFLLLPSAAQPLDWELVRVNKQQKFKQTVPPGNYSGIVHLRDQFYAVVDDKSQGDGFWRFQIEIDSLSGLIRDARRLEFIGNEHGNRDAEGIAFDARRQLIYISGERDNDVLEYSLDGQRTGRQLAMPAVFSAARRNGSLESLSFDSASRRFWTTSELPLPSDSALTLRMQRFDDALQPDLQLLYYMEQPEKRKPGRVHVHGVSEILAVGTDSLLVLERELYVPQKQIGSCVINKLFFCKKNPQSPSLEKRLLCRWKTRMNLSSRSFANYEAMCLGPRLSNGNLVIILLSDSQKRYKGLMSDWFRTIIVK